MQYLILKIKVCGVQLHSIKKLTLGKNFWQCLEKNEIKPVFQKIPFLLFFSNEECLSLKSIKGQFWDLAVGATLEKKFGKTFPWVCMGFFKKASQKSGILIKTGQILQTFWSF